MIHLLAKYLLLFLTYTMVSIAFLFGEENEDILIQDKNCVIVPKEIREHAQNNPILKQNLYDLKASRLGVRYATIWENPEISFDSAYKSGEVSGMTIGISISQKLPFLGKESTYKKLNEENARMHEMNVHYAALMAEAEAFRKAYEIYILDKKIDFYKNHLKNLNIVFAHKSRVHQKSPARWIRITNLSIYKNRIQNDLAILTGARKNSLKELNSMFGKTIPDECKFSFQDNLKNKLNWETIEKSTLERTAKENYHILLLKEKKRREQLELRLAKKMNYPDITISGYYNSEPGNPNDRYYGAGVSLPIPVINRNQSEIKIAENNIAKTTHEIEMTEKIYFLTVESEINRIKEFSQLYKSARYFTEEEISKKEVFFRASLIRQRISIDDYLVFLQESREYILASLDLQLETWNLMINLGLYSAQKNYWEQFYD